MNTKHTGSNMSTGTAVLWSTALLLAALVIVQAGKLESRASADQANSGQLGFSVCSATTGQGTPAEPIEAVYIVDSRDEVLLVYAMERFTDMKVQLRHTESLPNLFMQARR